MAIGRINASLSGVQPGGLAKIVPTSVAVGSGSGSVDSNGNVTFSGASSVSLNGCFSSSYENYRVVVRVTNNSADTDLFIRLRNTSNTDITANYYFGGYYSRVDNLGAGTWNGNNVSYWHIGSMDIGNTVYSNSVSFDLYNPNTSTYNKTMGMVGVGQLQTGSMFGIYIGGSLLDTTVCNGISLISTAGNIGGTIRIYGYN
jgi:hypothetical protein